MAMMQKSTTSSTTHYIAVLQDIVEENKREYEDDKQETRESQEKVFKRLADIENHMKEAEQDKEELVEGYKRKYEDEQRVEKNKYEALELVVKEMEERMRKADKLRGMANYTLQKKIGIIETTLSSFELFKKEIMERREKDDHRMENIENLLKTIEQDRESERERKRRRKEEEDEKSKTGWNLWELVSKIKEYYFSFFLFLE